MDGLWRCNDLVGTGAAAGAQPRSAGWHGDGLARLGGWAMRAWHAAAAQYARRQPPQHRRALRSRQRVLRPVPVAGPDVLLGAVDQARTTRWRLASTRKLDRICRKLQLHAGRPCLEIGTGWGGFAIHAARHYGCQVTTTTISREQHALARERVAAAGLGDRSRGAARGLSRPHAASYDKLVSIEMIEAIGAPVSSRPTSASSDRCLAGRAGPDPGDHHRGPPLPAGAAMRWTSSSATSFRAASFPR